MSDHDLWQGVLYLHLLAMAYFVGGQLVFGIAVVPVLRSEEADPARERMRGIARRFGYGSLVALGVLVATGWEMASHYDRVVRCPPRSDGNTSNLRPSVLSAAG